MGDTGSPAPTAAFPQDLAPRDDCAPQATCDCCQHPFDPWNADGEPVHVGGGYFLCESCGHVLAWASTTVAEIEAQNPGYEMRLVAKGRRGR